MRLIAGCLSLILFSTLPAVAQDHAADVKTAFARAQHLKRGINVSHWFSQSPNDYSTHHTDTFTDAGDIALIAKMGFDNVRLSIDATPLEQYPRGKDGLNADFVGRLDRAVDAMLADGLAVTIDLHPEDGFKLPLRTGNDGVAEPGRTLCRARSGTGLLRDHERAGGERRVPLGGDSGAGGRCHSRGCTAAHDHCHGAELLRHCGPADAAGAARRQRDL